MNSITTRSHSVQVHHSRVNTPARDVHQEKDEVILTVVRDIVKWIDGHLDSDLRLDIVTEKSGYTHWYFQRRFKDITGMSLADYIRLRRILNATNALISTDEKILTIAIDNGFSSQQTFTRVFRRYLKKTPGSVRRGCSGKSRCVEMLESEMFHEYPWFNNSSPAH